MPKAVYRTLKPGDDFAATEGSISDRTPGPMESSDSEGDTLDDDSAAQIKGRLKTVWEGGKMKKEHKEGKKVMKCYHCGGQWNSWNHTKAIGHVLGGCKDIKSCPKVSESWRKLYRTVATTNYETKKSKLEHTAKIHMGADAIEAGISKKMSARRSSPRLKKKAASKKRILEDSEEEEEEEDSSDDILEVYSPPTGRLWGPRRLLLQSLLIKEGHPNPLRLLSGPHRLLRGGSGRGGQLLFFQKNQTHASTKHCHIIRQKRP